MQGERMPGQGRSAGQEAHVNGHASSGADRASVLTLATSGLLSVGFSSVCTARTFLAS